MCKKNTILLAGNAKNYNFARNFIFKLSLLFI